jgi:hypothetical protein
VPQLDDVYLVEIEGVGDRDAAQKMRDCRLYGREEERPDLVDDEEFYVRDLVGMQAVLHQVTKRGDGWHLEGVMLTLNSRGCPQAPEVLIGTITDVVTVEEYSRQGLGNDLLEVELANDEETYLHHNGMVSGWGWAIYGGISCEGIDCSGWHLRPCLSSLSKRSGVICSIKC